MASFNRQKARNRRHIRVRKHVTGTQERPRLAVYRSLHHIYAQLIDDNTGQTLVAASTVEPEIKDGVAGLSGREAAKVVGNNLAQRAVANGFSKVVFDRGGNIYHGRVAALAEGAREGGLDF